MQNNLPEFVGNQTPKIFADDASIYFVYRFKTGHTVSMSLGRVYLNKVKRYKSIEDILADVSILPLDINKYTLDNLKMHVAHDGLVPHPKYFEEYSIVAHTSKDRIDCPIAYIEDPAGEYYVAHPEIAKLVKRVPLD